MATFLFLLVVAAALLAAARFAQQRLSKPRSAAQLTAPAPPGALGLKVGDVVMYDAQDWVIEGALRFDEDGFRWTEYLLVDGDAKRWLSVEDDEGLTLSVTHERVVDPDLADQAGAKRVQYRDTSYVRKENGHARWTGEGSQAGSGTVEYFDYEGPDGKQLSFERYSSAGSWEISLSREISEAELDIYPAKEPA